jgi:hypothetical protein
MQLRDINSSLAVCSIGIMEHSGLSRDSLQFCSVDGR